MRSFDELLGIIEAAKPDVEKTDRGNKAAGTRIRAAMQAIKKAAQEVRKEVLAVRQQDDTGAAAGPAL